MLAFGGIAGGCSGSDDDEGQTVAAPPPTIDRSEKPPPVGDGEGGVALTEIGSFDQPVFVTQPESEPNRLYVVEQCGRIQRIPASGGDPELFLDISELVTCDGEQGLLSIAFDPGYADNGRFYVDYTDKDGLGQIVEYKRSADDVGDPQSARPLLEIEDFAPNHNGGLLLFAPDGTLLIGSGDGGGAGDPERTAQDLGRLLGKILRIDPDPKGDDPYRIPNDNPFVEDPEARGRDPRLRPAQPVAVLVRPQRPATCGSATSARTTFEEIDAATATELTGLDSGLNFGWSAFEGSERFNEDEEAGGGAPAASRVRPRPRLFGDRRLRRSRPGAALALRSLPLRRLLRGPAAQLHRRPQRAGRRRPPARTHRRAAELVRRGHRRADLRDLSRRARLPAGRRAKLSRSRPSRVQAPDAGRVG